MSAPEGNQNALKFDTPEKRKQLLDNYVAHVESGLSDECFPDCDPTTFKKYVEQFPFEFDTDRIQIAKRKRQLFWESAGLNGTMGRIEGFNASSWKFNMGNRFGWSEKREDTVKVKKDSAADLAKRVLDEDDEEEDTSIDEFDSISSETGTPENDLGSDKTKAVQEN